MAGIVTLALPASRGGRNLTAWQNCVIALIQLTAALGRCYSSATHLLEYSYAFSRLGIAWTQRGENDDDLY